MVPTKKASTSEDAEAAAVARQNQLNEQQAQGFLYFFSFTHSIYLSYSIVKDNNADLTLGN